MDNMIYEALVGLGELTLIMVGSALIIWFGYVVKQAICKKPCDKEE